jgi:rubrerythrin
MDERISRRKTPGELLELALAKEKQSHAFYEALLAHGQAGLLRELVEQLKDEEYNHVRRIEQKLAELNLGRL